MLIFAADRLSLASWLRLHFIRLNGTFAGVACCFQFRHRYYGYLSGFDPELGRYGLGSLLVAEAVRQAIEERCLHFDMLRGEENYKCHWGCGSTLNKNLLFVSSRGLRARLISSLSWLERNFLNVSPHACSFEEITSSPHQNNRVG